ncbi:MAG: NADH-quinone oxidoreductase subunit L [Actinomycetales bacterium]|nr:NADH-quinone oxidoreductase subunit L [Tetrasphaera sp.]NLX00808.1 NADH-quinone oxidoreductase subunit L [Actinomycetales bacterium]
MTSLVTASAAAAGAGPAYAWLLVALPLLGAAVLLLGGRRTDSFGPLLATALSWASFVVALPLLFAMLSRDPSERAVQHTLYSWIPVGDFQLDAGILLDPLSISFVLLITFVGSLIHVYSLGYMKDDPSHVRGEGRELTEWETSREPSDRRRFFAYLNLFVAAMLLLVLADSYALLFVGWEGVGLASYLLIGFWNQNRAYATAANKAFWVNRVGDMGVLAAMMAMFASFGALDFATVAESAPEASTGLLVLVGLLLLLGATGKSAQFPLQSWLGDAMAGPTPVSALIHAATMVTAGVYLIVRSAPIFDSAPTAQTAVAVIGAITLLYGAIVGLAKDDIKKALAASTMSQIGYMMLAAGLGPVGYVYAIMHLLTHGFFKAGMFLGAGSVMHGMKDEVNMRRFGNLNAFMKITWVTFGLGWLAIIGVPPFSGFWSKDGVIESAFVGEGIKPWLLGGAALIGAGITAFYMSRLFFMTFHGKARWDEKEYHPHESPLTMTVPMMVLSVGSAALGLILYFGGFKTFLEPVVGHAEEHHPVLPVPVIMGLTLALVAIGAFLAYRQYAAAEVPVTPPEGSWATKAARADLYQEEVNRTLFEQPGVALARGLDFADRSGVDGTVGGLSSWIASASSSLRRLQNGLARSYALTMLSGVVVLLGAMWVMQ